MAWQTVAEGKSLAELRPLVVDMELPKGTKVRAVFDLKLPLAWAFDMAGAELAFRALIPQGLKLIDVYGEGGKGIVDMEADPAWLAAALVFIKTHWVAIAIAGLLLPLIISFIRVSVDLVRAPAPIPWLVAIVGGLLVYSLAKPIVKERKEKE